MRKFVKYFAAFLILILLLSATKYYFTNYSLNKILSKKIEVVTINNASVVEWIGPYDNSYTIKDKKVIDNLLSTLGSIRVRFTLFPDDEFHPTYHDNYIIMLNSSKKSVVINILDKDYLKVDREIYKIVKEPDLQQIYEIVTSEK